MAETWNVQTTLPYSITCTPLYTTATRQPDQGYLLGLLIAQRFLDNVCILQHLFFSILVSNEVFP